MITRFGPPAAAALILLLAPVAATAQQQQQPGLSQAAPARGPDPRADVTFGGGTVKQYIDAVAKAFGSANAAIQPGVEGAPVGPVELKNVTRRDAIMLIEGLSGTQARVQDRGETFIIFTDDLRKNVREVRVWPLAKVLSQIKPDEALSAVQAALDLAGKGAEVKFHEDTTLLIISGTSGEIEAVEQVINRLESVAGWRQGEQERDDADDAARDKLLGEIESLRNQNAQLTTVIRNLEIERANLQLQLKRP